VEKGGLATTLKAAGLRLGQVIAQADERRLGGQVRRVWAPRGVKVRPRRPTVDHGCSLALAVDGVALPLRWLPNLKRETIAARVNAWQEEGVAGRVWDGSGSHRAQLVRAAGPVQELCADAARLRWLVGWDWTAEAVNHLPIENAVLS
jgi:hypothetical protein